MDIINIPIDVQLLIINNLDYLVDLVRLSITCKTFYNLITKETTKHVKHYTTYATDKITIKSFEKYPIKLCFFGGSTELEKMIHRIGCVKILNFHIVNRNCNQSLINKVKSDIESLIYIYDTELGQLEGFDRLKKLELRACNIDFSNLTNLEMLRLNSFGKIVYLDENLNYSLKSLEIYNGLYAFSNNYNTKIVNMHMFDKLENYTGPYHNVILLLKNLKNLYFTSDENVECIDMSKFVSIEKLTKLRINSTNYKNVDQAINLEEFSSDNYYNLNKCSKIKKLFVEDINRYIDAGLNCSNIEEISLNNKNYNFKHNNFPKLRKIKAYINNNIQLKIIPNNIEDLLIHCADSIDVLDFCDFKYLKKLTIVYGSSNTHKGNINIINSKVNYNFIYGEQWYLDNNFIF